MIKQLMKKYGVLKTTAILSVICIISSEFIASVSWYLAGLPNQGFLLVVAFLCPAIIAPVVIVSLCHLNENISKKEEFLNVVLDAIQDGVSVIDKNLNIIRVNKFMRELYSHLLPLEGNKKCYEVYHGRSKPCDICPTLRAFKSGKLEVDEVPLTTEEGVKGTLELFSTPIIDKSGNVTGVVEHVRDISSHLKTIEALSDSEERYKTLFESANDAIFIHDLKGKILDVNSTAYERLGYTKEELLEMDINQLDHPDFAAKIPKQIEQIKEHGKAIFETVHIKKDGSIMPVEINALGIVLTGEKVIFSVARDITLRKQLAEELLKTGKLETTGMLAGGIAHDFNNILTAILGNINLALADTELKDRTKKLLSDAEIASLRATGLTQQLLTFAKGGEPVKELAPLDKVIKETANFCLLGDKIACRYNIPEDLWPVDIDKGQISQVVQNIVINASHAMPEGGTITITCENIPSVSRDIFPSAKPGRFVQMSIQDHGIGIPANLEGKIFDPYFSTKHKGSGLGLAITHSIIKKHGGYIMAESTPGVGTTFTVYLPASEKQRPQKQELSIETKASPKAEILLMDDQEMVRNIGKEMLVQLGHEVVLAEHGDQAITLYREAFAKNNKFDLVIMDLTVPGEMGGEDAVREIQNIDPHAKVIVSSGYSNDQIMADFKNYGFCAAILKPYRLQKLSEIISQFLS